MIKPTIGRIVWFWPDTGCHQANGGPMLYEQDADGKATQPLAAEVCFVHSDVMVNLRVTDHNGRSFPMPSVALLQPDALTPPQPTASYCEWMPFQVGQAKAAAVDPPVVEPVAQQQPEPVQQPVAEVQPEPEPVQEVQPEPQPQQAEGQPARAPGGGTASVDAAEGSNGTIAS